MSSSNKINVLVAYPYLKTQELAFFAKHKNKFNILVDSGAFTAWKAGIKIDRQEYLEFIKALPFQPWGVFTLDVIGNPEASMDNYQFFLKNKLRPIPIFTRGEKEEVLESYYNTSDFVAVGGLVGTQGNRGFINGIMERVKGRKVHWLGFTQKDFLMHYQPYSCDSSSWASGLRFGSLKLYVGRGKSITVTRKYLMQKPPQNILNLLTDVYRVDIRRLLNTDGWVNAMGGSILRELTFKSALLSHNDINKHLKTNYFLALANANDLESLLKQSQSIGSFA